MRNYLVAGWEAFQFIITPDELEECLTEFHLVIHNAHVPIDYVESSLQEYISGYRELFDLLASGEKLIWKQHYPLLETRGLTTNLARCDYGRVHEYQGSMYKAAVFDEPCVVLAPFTFNILNNGNGKPSISTKVSYLQYPEYTVGLELSYPKKIQYQYDGTERYEPLRSTKDLQSYRDFLLLKERIQKITDPFSFDINSKKVRTRVRISGQALQSVYQYYFFRENNICS